MNELNTVRREIDRLDEEIKSCLLARMACSCQVGKIKRQTGGAVFDGTREAALLNRLTDSLPAEQAGPLRRIYQAVLAESRKLQQETETDGKTLWTALSGREEAGEPENIYYLSGDRAAETLAGEKGRPVDCADGLTKAVRSGGSAILPVSCSVYDAAGTGLFLTGSRKDDLGRMRLILSSGPRWASYSRVVFTAVLPERQDRERLNADLTAHGMTPVIWLESEPEHKIFAAVKFDAGRPENLALLRQTAGQAKQFTLHGGYFI